MWILSVKVRQKWVGVGWIGIATDSPGRVRFKHGSYEWKLKDRLQTRTPPHDTRCGMFHFSCCVVCVWWHVGLLASGGECVVCWTALLAFESFLCACNSELHQQRKNVKTPGEWALRNCTGLNTLVERRVGGKICSLGELSVVCARVYLHTRATRCQ